MQAIIYHNPRCGTSRKTLEILEKAPAIAVRVIQYLENPPTKKKLADLYKKAGITPRDGLRAKEPLAKELGLNDPDVTDDQILNAMVKNPILINRPIVETTKGVRLCRPQDLVKEII
ncbi:arsenate reductase (glutaredoxin) [Parasphingopyxis marina]|uniref:Arsenate reductase n=1 Tax=Parasphingopyxis marina TaxID=2761622 RepID=A0A842HWE8_9SPHN|nr:arsenate reductase (glutaredoxin) [Parasphingopyxis marina]MBC2777225.1 arsenate reductase (glutaredoxin) [Parasphingopyxis marina]